MLKKVKGTV